MRCVLEARSHDANSFVTLTYNDENLPANKSLEPDHLRKFLDRLRKKKGPFRYYACGEYGDHTKRAHYHACLFGMQFADKIELQKYGDTTLYYSAELEQLWGHGHTSVGDVTFESAAYCARYVLKKRLSVNKQRQSHYYLKEETGELIPVIHPFARMSLATAIGRQWLSKNHADIYSHDKDFLVMRGKEMKPPKYFDRIYDTINPERMARIKETRKEKAKNYTLEELRTHETRARARLIQRKKV